MDNINSNSFKFETVAYTTKKKLKIDKRLPQLLLPMNKLDMFKDWWNEDIRHQDTIPHSFEEGYFMMGVEKPSDDRFRVLLRTLAKTLDVPVYKMRSLFEKFIEGFTEMTLYFKFLDENRVYFELYGYEGDLMSKVTFTYGSGGSSQPMRDLYDTSCVDTDDMLENLYYDVVCYWATVMWYIATTTTTTKYYYETKSPIITSRHKNVVNVSSVKTINTPIYDMSKIRFVKTEKLVARRKGWTYSHSFQVHGHYRHYKNGKVIFINPFIKGKGKEFKAQAIKINPK